MRINQLETNTEETIQEGDIVSFEFNDELAVDGIVVEGEDGLEIQLDEEAEHYLTELVPLAIGAAGAAWTAYDAYQAKKAYDAGEITAQELATRIGTDAALSLAGGAVAKGVGKLAKKAVGMFRKGKDTPADTAATAAGAQTGSTQSTRVANKIDNTIDRRKNRGGRLGRAARRMSGGTGANQSMNGVDTDVFARGFADDIERLRQLSGLTEEYLIEGTWAVPNTMELAKKLEAVMANPIPAKDASDVMYSLIGDDELFDSLYELETDDPSADARPTIIRWIQSNRKLLDFNTDDKEVMSVIDNIAGVSEEEIDEAEYQGRKVKLGKPTRGDVKKFKVYVKNDKGNVVKVNFGHKGKGNEKTMRIKKSDPKRRKSFRARHNCDNPGPRWKARYWSCRAW